MKHAPTVFLVEDDDFWPDLNDAVPVSVTPESCSEPPCAPPSVLAWWEHSDGYVVESNGARWLIGPGDIAGIERLSRLIRTEFGAPCAGNC